MKTVLGLAYDGTEYLGWQEQIDGPSIASCLRRAIWKALHFSVELSVAGRTDQGVHASQQIVSLRFIDYQGNSLPSKAWMDGVNAYLPRSIRILWVQSVPVEFDARFSALARRYRYQIYTAQAESPFMRQYLKWSKQELDIEAMNKACSYLLGEFDFSAFRASMCQAHSPIRTIRQAQWQANQNRLYLDIEANGFLHHMVRNIVGTCLEIGRGQRSPHNIIEVLAKGDRRLAGPTAEACGLYFCGAQYAEQYQLPAYRVPDDPLDF